MNNKAFHHRIVIRRCVLHRSTLSVLACLILTSFSASQAVAAASAASAGQQQQQLISRAVLPADTFATGPTSGQFAGPGNGRTPPFVNQQPVQGFSGVLRAPDGDFYALSDNGFGSKANSPDYVLRVYRIDPDFKTRSGGTGNVAVKSFFTLRDPDRQVRFPVIADRATYPGSSIPVDPAIRDARLLTGSDFDIESFRQTADGTFWFGDEFGPYLLHTDATGKVLEPPFRLPGVSSPDNTSVGGLIDPNLPRSRGFEGMALSTDGTKLYPILEGSLTTDPDQQRLIIYEFDLTAKRYTGKRWFYRLETTTSSGQAIGDFTAIGDNRFLIIERDGGQGINPPNVTPPPFSNPARFKKIYVVHFNDVESFVTKRELVDLLNIADPDGIGGADSRAGVFTFPFVTIESVIPLSANTIGVLNDNNYPGSAGRTPGQPDNNEFIIIQISEPLLKPLVIGHRGASGYRPEHTLEAYELAINQGADFIEPDLVSTKDGVLVARHENALAIVNATTGALIERTTDITDRPEFASRRTTKVIDGASITGWFTEDMTLAELKTLRAVERIPLLRPQNTAFDNQFQVPTLQEVIDLAKRKSAELNRQIGIYPETKHPTYFDSIGLSLEEPLLETLNRNGYLDQNAPVFIQSFEVSNLKELRTKTQVRLVQLFGGGRPYDFVVNNDPRTYANLATPAGLAEIATYAQGIGPSKDFIIPRNSANQLLAPTALIENAHALGLIVHAYTFRNENNFLPQDFRVGNPAAPTYLREYGNADAEYKLFYSLGLDGLFSDNPNTAVAAR